MLFTMLVISIAIGVFFVVSSAQEYENEVKSRAIELAISAEAFILPEYIQALSAKADDTQKKEYAVLKSSLMTFKERNKNVTFAYLMVQKDDKIYFLVDCEPPDSDDYSPPGQEYFEATEQDYIPLRDGTPVLTKPVTDRWGTWISALVPVKNRAGDVIAAFGVDFPAREFIWEITTHVIHSVIVAICILLMLFAVYYMLIKRLELKSLNAQLKDSEVLFRAIFEQAPIGIAVIGDDYSVVRMNPTFEQILGRTKEEWADTTWVDVTHADDLGKDVELYKKFKTGEINGYALEKRCAKPDGTMVWILMVIAGLHLNGDHRKTHLCIIKDIQESKEAEAALRESERSKSVFLSNLPGMAYRCRFDREWTMQFVSDGCLALTGYKPKDLLNNAQVSYNSIIAPEYRENIWYEWDCAVKQNEPFKYEYEIITASGERKWVLEMGQCVMQENGIVDALEGIIFDITESKERFNHIQFLNTHDYLTGLYNRGFFEEAKEHLDHENYLPLSIIIADINGVRLINDAFGHEEGDRIIKQTAMIIQNCCKEGAVISRTGGDDFGILLPNTDLNEALQIAQKIKNACDNVNSALPDIAKHINLSVGVGIRCTIDESIQDASKQAEEYMNKRKLLEQKSYHNAILSSIMATMYARSQETEEHAQRLAGLCKMIGQVINLSQKSLDELELLSMLHDIGKVGIDDRILNKPDSLTKEEWTVMKKHSEIGYRIVSATPDLASVAEYILCHHERWDGKGYPQGLKGDQIPLLSRILAVADSFDAMTEDRVYRKAMSKDKAFEEIRRNAGLQFDPKIVEIFMDNLEISGDK